MLAALVLSVQGQVFLIDDFEAAPFTLTGGSTTFQTYSDPSILGGFRQVRMAEQETPLENVNTTVADGLLTFNEVEPSALVMRYGSYSDANNSTALHLDLSQPYNFTIDVDSLSGPFAGSIDFYHYNSGTAGHFYDGISFNINAPGIHSFSFNEINEVGWVDASDIWGFQISIATGFGENTGTYSINNMSLTPIPEPGLYAAASAIALIFFAVIRRITSRSNRTHRSQPV